MTPAEKIIREAKRIAKLDAQLRSGDPLTVDALARYLNVDRKYVPRIVEAQSLVREGRTYPWRRIWRSIHGTEGARLTEHLAVLKERHPGSRVLAGIDDLEAALRVPLIDFATMAARLGRKPDTLSKRLRRGQEALPFPSIDLGSRTRHFRALEVRLWVEEEIRLELPELPEWLKTAPPPEAAEQAPSPVEKHSAPVDLNQSSPEQAKKDIFGGFGRHSRTTAT